MTDEVRAGIIRAGLGAGLLFLFVTGRMQGLIDGLTSAVSGSPAQSSYSIRDIIAKSRPAVNTQGK